MEQKSETFILKIGRYLLQSLRFLIWLVIPGAILYGGYIFHQKLSSLRKKPSRVLHKNIPLVEVKAITPQDIHLVVEGYGRVRPKKRWILTTEVAGRALFVSKKLKTGDFVRKGEVLIQLDAQENALKADKIKAEIEKNQVKIEHLQQEKRNAQARLNLLEQNVELARIQKERSFQLKESGAGSSQLWDRDQQAYLDQSNRFVELQNRSALIPIQIKEWEAQVKTLKVDLAQVELDQKRAKVKAPFDARVRSAQAEVGELIKAGTSLAVLEDYHSVEIPVMIPLADFYKLGLSTQEIQQLSQYLPELKVQVFSKVAKQNFSWGEQARITRIEPLDEESQTIPVIVEVKEPWQEKNSTGITHPILMTGSFCRIEMTGKKLNDVLLIPRSILNEKNRIYTIKDKRLEIKTIQWEYTYKNQIIVQQGLEPGEKVVLTLLAFPVSGMEVRTQEK